MNWQVGQNMVCDRPEQLLSGCIIVAQDDESVMISCPAVGIVVTGEPHRLQELGWKTDDKSLRNSLLPMSQS
ncbi:hypothetical protein BST81_14115 [Leptolyngbya sp. 'hensonii']|uniref:hypothetical protein n=1 Tax=Leptolyngbya sp. 'hensonii' TaxID=1922337 RepID=UPI0009500DBE|nr:hypothetical protein [Leptolyngbya sp. 'hensonii']OLP18148.1 hypothetical protein BST81_14115 [Leptolyngbya sp. 'hensonii']